MADDFLSKIRNINIVNRTFDTGKALPKVKTQKATELIAEVYRALGKYNELKSMISKILFSKLVDIEHKIKQTLLNNLNSFVGCSYTTIIPEELIDEGVDIQLKDLDYKKLLKNSPTSDVGKITYYDADAGLASQDLNTFLWNVINTNPNPQDWRGLVTIKFSPIGVGKTNVFNIKINETYRNQEVKQFNSDFINSLDIYDEKTLLTNLFDSSFGVVNNDGKSQTELDIQNELDDMVETILNSDDDFEDDDSALYGFSTDKYNEQVKQTIKQKFNLLNLKGKIQIVNTTFEDTSAYVVAISSTTNVSEKIALFDEFVDGIQPPNQFADNKTNLSPKIKQNIINSILDKLLLVISNVIISPKILIILYLNNYIVLGKDEFEEKSNIKSVIESLKTTIYAVIKDIGKTIIDYFTDNLIKEITNSVIVPTLKRKVKEKVNMKLAQIKSLVGL